ncbi:MAG: ATP synthase F1 subunit gamma, partial [Clostridia bacterium]|nr:ATP synthase F1 subunit gamma [Clostridia bacterium]
LRRAQERAVAARPYADRLAGALGRLAAAGAVPEHPLLARRTAGATAFIVMTADRGLAGAYNSNVLRHAAEGLAGVQEPAVIAVGRKGYEYFRRRGVPVLAQFLQIGEDARFSLAESVADVAMELFLEGRVREVRLVYTRFVTALALRPCTVPLLPVAAPGESGEEAGVTGSYIFVPSAAWILGELLPKLVKNQVYQGLLEAKASEHAARMTAMRSATDNASELIEVLNLEFNRARQAAITTEIAEIVGGAEALGG